MNAEDLIRSLSEDVNRVSRASIGSRMAGVGAVGALMALLLVLFVLGARPDLGQAVRTFPFWMKCAYSSAVFAIASTITLRLSHPGAKNLSARWLAAPAGVLALIALFELARAPIPEWHALLFGHSALYCPWRIGLLSLPIFVGFCCALRLLAPTNLRATGAMSALAAGACAATFYGLACNEVAAPFVLAWYSIGIGISTSVGALAGPWILRW
jgi:hypothetical protein